MKRFTLYSPTTFAALVTGVIVSILIYSARSAIAAQYFGRITTGSYVSNEQFKVESDGLTSNSFATVSSRFFLRVYEISQKKLEWVTDFRDKHDFFDKVDAPGLRLTPNHTAQVRQFSLRTGSEADGLIAAAGRFAVPDTGAVTIDGASVGLRWNRQTSASLFGGLNPQRPDQTEMTFNSDSTAFGANFVFQPKSRNWKKSFYLSNAIVQERVAGHLDRQFVYSNLFYQWGTNAQVFALLYLDFVPRVYAQTGLVNYVQALNPKWTSTLRLSSVNALEYFRTQGVLERLEPSAYREAGILFQNTLSPRTKMNYSGRYGMRTADLLSRTEASMGPSFSQVFSKNFNLQTLAGYRRDFTNHTTFLNSRLGYYRLNWEGDLSLDLGIRRQSDRTTTHPIVLEGSIARYFSKVTYASLTVQEARDENVNILSLFVKLGYRFGSSDVAPLKDGAPPPGGRP